MKKMVSLLNYIILKSHSCKKSFLLAFFLLLKSFLNVFFEYVEGGVVSMPGKILGINILVFLILTHVPA